MTGANDTRLGIDFGTTYTVAALAGRDGRGQPLLFDASLLLPSAVFAEIDGRLLVGHDAERGARLEPTRFEPNPKRRIDDNVVLLGSREFPVADLIAAVLRRVSDEAARVAGGLPAATVLTYPATWAGSRKSVLADAARRAGIPAVTLVPEPVAAAFYFTQVLGRVVAPGTSLVVYDLGGGTFDTSVLRHRPDGGWDVVVADGLGDVGGLDLDAVIVDHLRDTIGVTDPDRWRQLTKPDDDVARRRYRLLWDEASAAKEQLSRSSSATIQVPLFDVDVYLTRDEFERLARPYLERTADLTAATLQRAGTRPDQLAGLFLVGGSSRIPLVSTLLHHRLGVAPTLIEQPELVVALGSLHAVFGPPVAAPGDSPPPPAAGRADARPKSPRRRGRWTLPLVAAGVVALLIVAGIGGAQVLNKTSGSPRTSVSGRTSDGRAPSIPAGIPGLNLKPGARQQSSTVNKTVWYAGLKITFGQLTYDADRSPQLSVDTVLENLGSKDVPADVALVFSTDGQTYPGRVRESTMVPAGQKAHVHFYFDISAPLSGDLARAEFLVGRADEARDVVPVGSGELVGYEPTVVLKDRKIVHRDLVLTFTVCDLRGGFTDWHGQVKKGYAALTCSVDLQYTGGGGAGHYVGEGNFRLGLPDGTEIGPTVAPNEPLYSANVVPGTYLGFTIKWPAPGAYLLRVVDVHAGETRSASSVYEIPLTL